MVRAFFVLGIAALSAAAAQPIAARESAACLPQAEFDAAFSDQVRNGQQAIVTSRYAGRSMCNGKSFAVRLQELRQEYFPEEAEARERGVAARVARDRAERQEREAREALWDARNERLAEAEYRADLAEAENRAAVAKANLRADLAEAEWREQVAQAKAAEARLSRAETERRLAALPPGRIRQSVLLAKASPVQQDQLERAVEAVVRQDSQSWYGFRGYKKGSLFDTQLRSYDAARENYLIFSRFKYDNNSTGWVEVEYTGRQFKCVTFHNDDKPCRQIGDTQSKRFAGNVLTSFLTGVVSSRVVR